MGRKLVPHDSREVSRALDLTYGEYVFAATCRVISAQQLLWGLFRLHLLVFVDLVKPNTLPNVADAAGVLTVNPRKGQPLSQLHHLP